MMMILRGRLISSSHHVQRCTVCSESLSHDDVASPVGLDRMLGGIACMVMLGDLSCLSSLVCITIM